MIPLIMLLVGFALGVAWQRWETVIRPSLEREEAALSFVNLGSSIEVAL